MQITQAWEQLVQINIVFGAMKRILGHLSANLFNIHPAVSQKAWSATNKNYYKLLRLGKNKKKKNCWEKLPSDQKI